jgi:hypothetical protein
MGANWQELRELGNERAQATIVDAQRGFRTARVARTGGADAGGAPGGVHRRLWRAVRSLMKVRTVGSEDARSARPSTAARMSVAGDAL